MTEKGSDADRLGSTIGVYVLHEEIGRGGMGVVYRATRADTGLQVAVKLMLPELSNNIRFRERFITEAQTAPKLDHPNIVPIYEAGQVGSELYIAMRLVDGPDLKQVIENGEGLSPQRALAIVSQASAALDYAHGLGIVHRDIKPQNILLDTSEDGTDHVYITDFGLVKPAGSESTASRTSEVFGSIQYMAPEQVEGMPTDGRADVYSLGCVTFEALTGNIPFDRPNEVAVLWAHVHESPPRVTDVRRDLPGGLDIALANSMAKHPDDRYLTCGEFSDALQDGLEKNQRPMFMPAVRPLVARIPRKKTEREVWAPNFFPELSRVRKLSNRPNWSRVLGTVGAMSLVLTSLVHFGHPQGISGAAQDVADVAESVVSAIDPRSDPEEVVSAADARRRDRLRADRRRSGGLVGERRGPGQRSSEGVSAVVPGAPEPKDVVSPGAIVFSNWEGNDRELYKIDPDGTALVRLTNNDAEDDYPSWSPDGRMIVFSRTPSESSPELWIMKSDGSDERRIAILEGPTTDPVERAQPSWSPDGKRIVYSHHGIHVINLDGSGMTKLADAGTAPEWSPLGDKIVFARSTQNLEERPLWIMDPDGSGVRRLTNPSDAAGGAADGAPTWTPDGEKIVFTRGGIGFVAGDRYVDTAGLFVIDVDGTGLRRVTEGRGEYGPSLASTGSQMVFADSSGVLYVADLDGSETKRLTSSELNGNPDWRWVSS